jgi:hypothetical protein
MPPFFFQLSLSNESGPASNLHVSKPRGHGLQNQAQHAWAKSCMRMQHGSHPFLPPLPEAANDAMEADVSKSRSVSLPPQARPTPSPCTLFCPAKAHRPRTHARTSVRMSKRVHASRVSRGCRTSRAALCPSPSSSGRPPSRLPASVAAPAHPPPRP